MNNYQGALDTALTAVRDYGLVGLLAGIIIYWLLFPEKAEKVSSQLYRISRKFWKGAERKYITHDIQSHVNDYVNGFLSQKIKNFMPLNVKVDWIDENQTEESFISNNKLVIRMRSSDNQNKNLVNASMVFISQNLLHKAKHYISGRQKRSIDLFVANKLFETQREDIVKQFIEDFLLEETDDKKIAELFDKYDSIDVAGIFFPVFLEEMGFLGEKVFANKKDVVIVQEVGGLIDFLKKHSDRIVGSDNNQPIFQGKYCRFGIVIVGRSLKMEKEGQRPYINHIKTLCENNAETIYLIAAEKNEDFVREISTSSLLTKENFDVYNEIKYRATIHKQDGTDLPVNNYLLVLRKNKVSHYIKEQKNGT